LAGSGRKPEKKYSRAGFRVVLVRNDNRLPQRAGRSLLRHRGNDRRVANRLLEAAVIDADKYSSMAERNRVRYIPVMRPRRMLSRDGRVLVDNRPSFSVLLLRDEPAQVEKHLAPSRMAWESLG